MNFQDEGEYNQYMSDLAYGEAEQANSRSQAEYEQMMAEEQAKAQYQDHLVSTLPVTKKIETWNTTKSERSAMAAKLVEAMKEGLVNPLNVHMYVKCMEDMIIQLNSTNVKENKLSIETAKEYKKLVSEAAEKYQGNTFQYMNANWTKKEVGGRYDYSQCNDPKLCELQQSFELAEASLKQRQEYLKNVDSKGEAITDTETGEIYTIYPPAKPATTSVVSVSLK